jgi:hypothetical protein
VRKREKREVFHSPSSLSSSSFLANILARFARFVARERERRRRRRKKKKNDSRAGEKKVGKMIEREKKINK